VLVRSDWRCGARKEFNVPGLAVAAIKDGKAVRLMGYGVRRSGESAPVTPHDRLVDRLPVERAKMKAVSPLTDFSFDFQDLILKPVAKGALPY